MMTAGEKFDKAKAQAETNARAFKKQYAVVMGTYGPKVVEADAVTNESRLMYLTAETKECDRRIVGAIEWCACGSDTVICQRCGRNVCGNQATWKDGTGNLGRCCV